MSPSDSDVPVLLQMRGIRKAFPGVVALDDVSFDLRRGEVHALLGENGAGKSTLMKILSGACVRDAGEILIDERPVVLNSPREAQAIGISTIYQEFNLVPQLSAAENIYLGREPMIRAGVRSSNGRARCCSRSGPTSTRNCRSPLWAWLSSRWLKLPRRSRCVRES
jgi:ABC-type sugar transport system ATPase subunit